MRPPICDICDARFDLSGEQAGGLVTFKPSPDDQAQLARLRQPGFVGHPPNQEWFCSTHLPMAKALAHLELKEARALIKAREAQG